MRLRVTYHRAADLLADVDQQIARGGLLVRVEPGPVELFGPVTLELVTPAGAALLDAQVIQVMPGLGIAVGFTTTAALDRLVEHARTAGWDAGGGPVHEVVADASDGPAHQDGTDAGDATRPSRNAAIATGDDAAAARPAAGPVVDIHTRYRNASQHEKTQIALRGNRDERALILRDPTAKNLHLYVLRNPQVGLDEVAAIAAIRTVAPEVLTFIAGRREWAQRPEVATALVRNPKTPVPICIRLLDHVPAAELRQLAKAPNVRAPIQSAARKKVL